MPIPTRPNPDPYHYHVYDIPCAHGVVAAHGGGACGPHVAQMQFPSAHVNSWLPAAPAVPAAAVAAPPPHQARAGGATRTSEERADTAAAGALPANIPVHPAAPAHVTDNTANSRLSLLQDMADLQTAAGAGAPLYAVSGSTGTTYFGRAIRYIMFGGNNVATAPQVLLTGGIHAREWIAVEVPYLIAEYMIRNYLPLAARAPAGPAPPASQVRMSEVIDACRICVIPMLNPDGHCWSVATTERRWRKNRRRWSVTDLGANWDAAWQRNAAPAALPAALPAGLGLSPPGRVAGLVAPTGGPLQDVVIAEGAARDVFRGVDCNRNFTRSDDGKWQGSQAKPVEENFAGPAALSEAETNTLTTFIGTLGNLAGSIDYHSAMGRVFYHHHAREAPRRWGRIHTRRLVRRVAECMWNHVTRYQQRAALPPAQRYGNSHTTIEAESGGRAVTYGSVMDCCYARMVALDRVPLAYTIELDPVKSGGVYPGIADVNNRFFAIQDVTIQTVFEKNLTAALCLMWHASQNPADRGAIVRGWRGSTIAVPACPFRPAVGGGGGGNDMVAKIVGRGNQPPNP